MPVSALPYGEEAVFSAVRSLQAPASFMGPTAAAANANARLSAQLNSILCASRFAHFVKIIGRNMVGAFKTAGEIERLVEIFLGLGVHTVRLTGGEPLVRAQLYKLVAMLSARGVPACPAAAERGPSTAERQPRRLRWLACALAAACLK